MNIKSAAMINALVSLGADVNGLSWVYSKTHDYDNHCEFSPLQIAVEQVSIRLCMYVCMYVCIFVCNVFRYVWYVIRLIIHVFYVCIYVYIFLCMYICR